MIAAEQLIGSGLCGFLDRILAEHENTDVVVNRIAGRTYATVDELGFSLVSDDGASIDVVQLHGEGSGYGAIALVLPWGLSMDDSREVAQAKLGLPTQTGGDALHPVTGQVMRAWDAFVARGYRCHLEYHPNDAGIALLSIEAASS